MKKEGGVGGRRGNDEVGRTRKTTGTKATGPADDPLTSWLGW